MLTWIRWIALVASICEPLASNATGYRFCLTWWFTRSIAVFDWSDLHRWTLSFVVFHWWNLHGRNIYRNDADLIHSVRTHTWIFLLQDGVGSWLGGFIMFCGLAPILQGMRGLWATFHRGGASDTKEPNEKLMVVDNTSSLVTPSGRLM